MKDANLWDALTNYDAMGINASLRFVEVAQSGKSPSPLKAGDDVRIDGPTAVIAAKIVSAAATSAVLQVGQVSWKMTPATEQDDPAVPDISLVSQIWIVRGPA